MARVTSRMDYLNKLQFYLSFYFSENESTSILNDYEEWFENESLCGKSEEEICAALNEPQKVVKKLLAESTGHFPWITRLFKNAMIQLLILMVIHLFTALYFLKIYNDNGQNYLYFALISIFLYFFVGMKILKKICCPKSNIYKDNLLISGLALSILVFEKFFLIKTSHPYSGYICVIVSSVFLILLFCINIYIVIKNMVQNSYYVFLTTFHISGIMMLLLFLHNQLHMLYKDMYEYCNKLVFGSICLYAEIIVLCVVFFKRKKNTRNKSWTHS